MVQSKIRGPRQRRAEEGNEKLTKKEGLLTSFEKKATGWFNCKRKNIGSSKGSLWGKGSGSKNQGIIIIDSPPSKRTRGLILERGKITFKQEEILHTPDESAALTAETTEKI